MLYKFLCFGEKSLVNSSENRGFSLKSYSVRSDNFEWSKILKLSLLKI